MANMANLAGALGLAAVISGAVSAGPKEDELIDKIIQAYGGEKLIALESLVLEDRYKSITGDGGTVPGEAVVSRLHSTLSVDFKSGRKAVKNWAVNKNGNRLGQIMFDGEQGWSINFLRGSHVERDDLTGSTVGAGMMRLLDTTVVLDLHKKRSDSEWGGTVDYNGAPHDVITVGTGRSQYKAFVNSKTHLLTKMQRGRADYFYSGHLVNDGITYASDTNFLAGGQPRLLTLSRQIHVNPDVRSAFDFPAGSKKLKGMIDTAKMSVTRVAADSYLVGRGRAFSLFVDAGNHFVVTGGLPGTKARLEALNKELGTDKPIGYAILPEHHQSHLRGIDELAELGAAFVVHESHVNALKDKLSVPIAQDRIVAVGTEDTLADGKLRLFDITTIQSDHYLLTYVPEAELVFAVDDFGTNLLDSVPSADRRMISFRSALEKLPVKVSRIAYIHGNQPLTIEQLVKVTDAYEEGVCPEGEPICAE